MNHQPIGLGDVVIINAESLPQGSVGVVANVDVRSKFPIGVHLSRSAFAQSRVFLEPGHVLYFEMDRLEVMPEGHPCCTCEEKLVAFGICTCRCY